jgi:hypothetical protein
MLLDFDAFFWEMWRLGGHQGFVEPKNVTKGWEGLQLLKAYDKVKVLPFFAICIQHLQALTPPT